MESSNRDTSFSVNTVGGLIALLAFFGSIACGCGAGFPIQARDKKEKHERNEHWCFSNRNPVDGSGSCMHHVAGSPLPPFFIFHRRRSVNLSPNKAVQATGHRRCDS